MSGEYRQRRSFLRSGHKKSAGVSIIGLEALVSLGINNRTIARALFDYIFSFLVVIQIYIVLIIGNCTIDNRFEAQAFTVHYSDTLKIYQISKPE